MSKIYPIGRVYTIRSPNTDEVYIGSTFNPLYKRLGQHKKDYKRYKAGKFATITSFKILEAGNAYIELLQQYENLTKEQLNKYEGEYIRKTDNCVNNRIAGRTKKESYEDNKEQILKKRKEYCENNKEHIRDKKKEYYEDNKEQILKKRKEYYEDNKEEINKKKKKFYENNKEQILKKIDCGCGSVTIANKARHEKSKKHQEWLQSLN